jgi:drug/metabolite transporter (DMT)-like permease
MASPSLPLVLPRREAIVALLLGALTALYNWALLGSFNSIPFALAVLIIYFYPLIAAVIVAAFGWEKFAWKTGAAILLALVGLALALDVRGSNLNFSGVSLAFVAAVGLAVVVAVSIVVSSFRNLRSTGIDAAYEVRMSTITASPASE